MSSAARPFDPARGRWIPWVFVGMMLLVFVVNGALIVSAVSTFTGTTTGQSYDRGRAYNHVIEEARRQAALGWTPRVDLASGRLSVGSPIGPGSPSPGGWRGCCGGRWMGGPSPLGNHRRCRRRLDRGGAAACRRPMGSAADAVRPGRPPPRHPPPDPGAMSAIGRIVPAPAGTQAVCLHCGAPVQPPARFCCAGCEMAQRLGRGWGWMPSIASAWRRTGRCGRTRRRPCRSRPPRWPSQRVPGGSTLMVSGLQCGACVWLVEQALAADPDVLAARATLTTRRLTLRWRGDRAGAEDFAALLGRLGFRAVPFSPACLRAANDAETRRWPAPSASPPSAR